MPITQYTQYMGEASAKGKPASYRDVQADTSVADAVIEYGKALQYKAADREKVQVYGASGLFAGVALAQHFTTDYRLPVIGSDATYAYPANKPVAVARKGEFWVTVLEDVKIGDDAKIDNATGDFRPGTTATAGVSGVVGKFKSAATANGLAVLEINLP